MKNEVIENKSNRNPSEIITKWKTPHIYNRFYIFKFPFLHSNRASQLTPCPNPPFTVHYPVSRINQKTINLNQLFPSIHHRQFNLQWIKLNHKFNHQMIIRQINQTEKKKKSNPSSSSTDKTLVLSLISELSTVKTTVSRKIPNYLHKP